VQLGDFAEFVVDVADRHGRGDDHGWPEVDGAQTFEVVYVEINRTVPDFVPAEWA